jgi:hypothetical protein
MTLLAAYAEHLYAECHCAECHIAAFPSKWYAETPSLGDLVVGARLDALLSY